MGTKQPAWVEQGKVDLVYLAETITGLKSVIKRIEAAISKLDSEAYFAALSDWFGVEV